MYQKHLFRMLIAISFVIGVAVTVREAVAQANTTMESRALVCESLPSHYSFRTEYVPGSETLVTFTENGPTGVDGGLIELLSSYRSCSR